MAFLNRTEELTLLGDLFDSTTAQFLVLYGRRRVGKTELLTHFGSSRRSIFMEATDVRKSDQLRDFGRAYAAGVSEFGPEVRLEISDWQHALELIASAGRNGRTIVVLNEFQYLAKQEPGLGSIISNWWRTTGSQSNVVLVIAGSDISFFSEHVLGANAALHGRRTADYRVLPFTPKAAAEFIPEWTAEDAIRAYAIWGGMPYYLNMIDSSKDLRTNILKTILQPGAPLRHEADYLMHLESRLRDPAVYGSILRAIADGKTSASAIANHISGGTVSNVHQQLARLQEVGLVEEVRPVINAGRLDIRYTISDPFLRFAFRYVAPEASSLRTADDAAQLLDETILPTLDHFVSMPAFEEICRLDLRQRVGASRVGRWWGHVLVRNADGSMKSVQMEVDGVALDGSGNVIALATCRWSAKVMPYAEVSKLRTALAQIAPGAVVPLFLYSRSGVDEYASIEHEQNPAMVQVLAPADLYA